MTQKADCSEMAGAHPRPHDERVFMVLKYTETGNVLETIRRFQRRLPNRNVHYCRFCSNLDNTGHTYCNCPLLFVCMVSTDSETAFETFWLFPEHHRFLYSLNFETLNPCSSSEKCGLDCVTIIFVQFFYFLLHSSVSFLGFTYHKALQQFQNAWLCNTCDHPFV